MAREVKVGIVVSAKNAAAATMNTVGKSAQTTGRMAREAAQKAEQAFQAMGKAGVMMNQSLELGKKAFAAFDRVIGDTMRSALKFRSVNDGASKQIQELGRSLELVRARAGDALIPILQGIADVMGPLLKSWQQWLVVNRQMVGGKLIEWLQAATVGLTRGVAMGVIAVTKVWSGWKMLIDLTKGAIEKSFAGILDGIGWVTNGMAKLANAAGMESLASKLVGVTDFTKGLGEQFSRAGDESWAATDKIVKEQEKLEKQVWAVANAVETGIGKAAVAAQKRLAESTTGTTRTLEEQGAAVARLAERNKLMATLDAQVQAGITATHLANTQRRIDVSNAAAEHEKSLLAERKEFAQSVFATMGNAAYNAMEAMVTGAETAEEAFNRMGKTILQAVLAQVAATILARMAESAASAISAHSGIPFVGVALGVAAAGAAIAAIASFQKFAHGGEVTGGQRGKDSVPALLTPGEYVLNVDQYKALRGLMGAGPSHQTTVASGGAPMHFSRGGEVPGVAARGGLAPNVNLTIQAMELPSSAATQRFVLKNLKPALEELVRNGHLNLAR